MLNGIKYVFEGGMDPDFYDSVDEDELNSVLKKFYNKAKKEFPKWLNINRKVDNMAKKYYKENGKPSYVSGENYNISYGRKMFNSYKPFYENIVIDKELKLFIRKDSCSNTINNLISYSESGLKISLRSYGWL